MWRAMEVHAELPSANLHLTQLPADEPEGLVAITDHPTQGAFASAIPGRTLIASFLVHNTTHHGNAQFAGAIALYEVINKIAPETNLRWPATVCDNKSGRIVAGVRVDLAHDNIALGFGINVEHHAHAVHRKEWTALNDVVGAPIDRWELLGDLMKTLDELIKLARTDSQQLHERYKQACGTVGRTVRATTGNGEVHEGRAAEITDEGALVIELGGNKDVVMSAQIEYLD